MVTNDGRGQGQRKGIGDWGRQGMEGENKRPFKDQNTPRWRALVFEWRDLQGGERAEGSSRHENPPDVGRGFVSAWRRTSRNTANVPKWARWWCSGGERM